jgi:hypothetical protein
MYIYIAILDTNIHAPHLYPIIGVLDLAVVVLVLSTNS